MFWDQNFDQKSLRSTVHPGFVVGNVEYGKVPHERNHFTGKKLLPNFVEAGMA